MSEANTPDIIIQAGSEDASVPMRVEDVLPDRLLLLPLQDRPFFPGQSLPIVLDAEHWRDTLQRVSDTPHKCVGLVLTRTPVDILPNAEDFCEIGTLARVHNIIEHEDRIQFIAEGLQRFRIDGWRKTGAPYVADVSFPNVNSIDPEGNPQEVRAYAQAVIGKIRELISINPLYRENVRAYLERFDPDDASRLSDFAAAMTSAEADPLQEILETLVLLPRLEKVMVLLQKELEVATLQSEIRQKVEDRISTNQREFFLKEQLREIQRELGLSKDDKSQDIDQFRQRLDSLEVPEHARERVEEELQKFSVLEQGSPEYGVCRAYLDMLTALPWGKISEDQVDLKRARNILDRDHEGLEDVKERIIEFLGVGALTGNISGSIVLFTGPPGVGKTSIGRTIAEALGREFYRFSLGGMRDEAEIKGHRRTYIGAMPGKFIQAIREVGTSNPVIMLDEVDKIGMSFQGDPASALLEVLDSEQNGSFLDHYLDVRFDLSKVLFLCTANQIDNIPRPLLDRMEIIRLSGYITEEKVAIGKKHLWPKQRSRAGLKAKQIKISDSTMRVLVDGYARESGVRNLEKQLGRIARRAAVAVLRDPDTSIRLTKANLEDYLGPPVFKRLSPQRNKIGVVTGLAWTTMGGATLEIETTRVHVQSSGFKLTGQLGEVMRESAEIAQSFIRSHASRYGIVEDFFESAFIHVHVPEGATPKDGPSAGITIATALLSLARGEKVAKNIAMTGELTLTGQVLPVGGIREKVVAAKREKIKELVLPEANRRDFEELPHYLKAGLQVKFASHYDDVSEVIF
jgi:ATP-dependent Lon protease